MASNNYAHFNTLASNVVCGQACELTEVTINTAGASANTLTLYDSATVAGASSSNTIAVINTVVSNIVTLDYNAQCRSGLVAVLATGTAADVTISFR